MEKKVVKKHAEPKRLECDDYLHHWADDKQSKARNSDSKYRQMALVGFDT